jgi:transposase
VERLPHRKLLTGDIQPLHQGGNLKSALSGYSNQLYELVEKYPDSTLSEYCEYWGNIYGQWVSPSTMCRELI